MYATLPKDRFSYTFDRRQLIPSKPNQLWLLEQGAVRTLSWNEQGTCIVLGYWGAGDVFGVPLSNLDPYQIQCLTTVKARCFSPSQWYGLSESVYQHIHQTKEFFCIVRSDKIIERLQQFLIWLCGKFGREEKLGCLIDLRLTHQEIAESIGTSRVTVSRFLSQFEQEGLIYRSGKDLTISPALLKIDQCTSHSDYQCRFRERKGIRNRQVKQDISRV